MAAPTSAAATIDEATAVPPTTMKHLKRSKSKIAHIDITPTISMTAAVPATSSKSLKRTSKSPRTLNLKLSSLALAIDNFEHANNNIALAPHSESVLSMTSSIKSIPAPPTLHRTKSVPRLDKATHHQPQPQASSLSLPRQQKGSSDPDHLVQVQATSSLNSPKSPKSPKTPMHSPVKATDSGFNSPNQPPLRQSFDFHQEQASNEDDDVVQDLNYLSHVLVSDQFAVGDLSSMHLMLQLGYHYEGAKHVWTPASADPRAQKLPELFLVPVVEGTTLM